MTIALLFGKLPAHGDFVSRGIAADERDALDRWLAASLADARDGLGDAFEEAYDVAPPWRFAWREPEDRWSAGAMAPSVDGVGRRYPIIVAIRGIAGEGIAPLAVAAESLIYDALAGGWTADRLVEAASVLAGDDRLTAGRREWTSPPGWWTVDESGSTAARIDGSHPPELMRTVLALPDMAGTGREGSAWA